MRGGSFDYEDVVQRRLNEESKERAPSDLVDLNDVNDQNRTISLSDNEEEEARDVVQSNRRGEFAFDPLGPENLNELDCETTN